MNRVYTVLAGLLMLANIANAQSPQDIREFITTPWLPVVTTAPVTAVTTASLSLTYSGQPTALDTFTIGGERFPTETYQFYTGTYAGAYTGLPIGSTDDVTYTSATLAITGQSNFVSASVNTGTNTTLLTALRPGVRGNFISVDTANVDNLTTGVMTGGATPNAGRRGSVLYHDSGSTGTLYIKLGTSEWPVWRSF